MISKRFSKSSDRLRWPSIVAGVVIVALGSAFVVSCAETGREAAPQATGGARTKVLPGELDDLRDSIKKEFRQRVTAPLEQAEAGLQEDSVGVPTLRLLVHWDYRNQARARLVQQLRAIASG